MPADQGRGEAQGREDRLIGGDPSQSSAWTGIARHEAARWNKPGHTLATGGEGIISKT